MTGREAAAVFAGGGLLLLGLACLGTRAQSSAPPAAPGPTPPPPAPWVPPPAPPPPPPPGCRVTGSAFGLAPLYSWPDLAPLGAYARGGAQYTYTEARCCGPTCYDRVGDAVAIDDTYLDTGGTTPADYPGCVTPGPCPGTIINPAPSPQPYCDPSGYCLVP